MTRPRDEGDGKPKITIVTLKYAEAYSRLSGLDAVGILNGVALKRWKIEVDDLNSVKTRGFRWSWRNPAGCERTCAETKMS
jgi:hypothetical protein